MVKEGSINKLRWLLIRFCKFYCRYILIPKTRNFIFNFGVQLTKYINSYGSFVVQSKDDRRFHVDLNDEMYHSLYFYGSYEPYVTELFKKIIRPDDILVDVGANFGWYTTLFSRLIKRGGQVHSFEPIPWIFNELQKNVTLNNIKSNVFLNQCALGNESKAIEMFVFSRLPCGHASISNLGRDDYTNYKCSMRTLDNYMLEKGISNVQVIKCDVEGAEMLVLEGADSLLSSSHPPIWLLELNTETSAHFGYQPCDLLHYLHNKNDYDFYRITSKNLARLYSHYDYKNGDNIICAIPGLHGERIGNLTE